MNTTMNLSKNKIKSFKNDKKIVLEALKQDGRALQYVSEELRNDEEIVLAAVKQKGFALKYVPTQFKNSKKIVLEAVKQYGVALQFASLRIQNDKEVVLEAVKQDGFAILYASKGLKNNKEFARELATEVDCVFDLNTLSNFGCSLEFMREYMDTLTIKQAHEEQLSSDEQHLIRK